MIGIVFFIELYFIKTDKNKITMFVCRCVMSQKMSI